MIKQMLTLLLLFPGFLFTMHGNAQLTAEKQDFPRMAGDDHVDVYYEFSEPSSLHSGGSPMESKVTRGFWNIAESARKRLICESGRYRTIASMERPAIENFLIGDVNLLGPEGLVILAEDRNGRIFRSDLSPVKARQNTWRAGPYYYDARLLDFQLGTESGDTLPMTGEFVLHAYPEKIHIEARLHLAEKIDLNDVYMVCQFSDRAKPLGPGWMVETRDRSLGILGGIAEKRRIVVQLKGENEAGGMLAGYLAFIPGKDEPSLRRSLEQAANPLSPEAIKVTHGVSLGYHPEAGFYEIRNIHGLSASNFTSFHRNPNMYLSTGLDITNDGLDRKVYIKHSAAAGAIESAILTDTTGFPLPVLVECAKNFSGEKEEPDDSPFNESYFPLSLSPSETKVFNILHLHQNWGDHALRQVSSIRFFQIYYHLSQGVTETTCFSLPTKFNDIPTGEARAYTLADYRPLSGQTWHGSPQHHHVALQGWLQYQDAEGHWRYPVYKGGEIYSAGPNLAWFSMNYISSDGKVDEELEIFEMPQEDESRTHIRLRYAFKADVEIQGDIRKNFRLLNSGSYIRKVNWKEMAWTSPGGEIRTFPIRPDGDWTLTGEPLRPYNSFFCAYPHFDGNNGVVIRKVSGRVNGAYFNRVGFSAIEHEDGKTELMLVPLIDGQTIREGSVIEIDCIMIPYGNEHSGWGTPYEESIRYGLNVSELGEYREEPGLQSGDEPVFGPGLQILRGQKILDLPPVVRAENDAASVIFSGGHERISLVATGFSSPKYPMLWDGQAYLDPQVRGHDGIQSFAGGDGTFGFVFTPRVRTTRVSGEWGSRPHTFHVTQAIADGDIREISSLNGRVKIEQYRPGRLEIRSPRLWFPARNEISAGPLYHTLSESMVLKTVPVLIPDDPRPEMIEILAYSPERIKINSEAEQAFTLEVRGLFPDCLYGIDQDGGTREIKSGNHGTLLLGIGTGVVETDIRIQK